MSKGNGHDGAWENLGEDVRSYMSQGYRNPNDPDPLPDPREATEFCAVWDKLATDPATSHLIDYINGKPCDPIPTLEQIVGAFFDAGKDRAVFAEQISAVIAICGGQLSRLISLRPDVVAIWGKLRSERIHDTEQKQKANKEGIPFAQSVAAFIKGVKPPEYLIEPVIQRGSLYTLSALTSHGKTAVLLYIALCIASGRPVAGKYTNPGRVIWFAGENPDDFAQKIVTACHHWNIDPAELDMAVIPGAFDLAGQIDDAMKMAAACGDADLVVVDTSAAYRIDDGEDDNANSLAWAKVLRRLLKLPGRPAVVTAAHPTKHADETNLLPRGGSAFLNEVDGNLTLWAGEDQETSTLHWQGKFRGMSFCPIQFDLRPCPHPEWKLRNGEPVTIKLAIPAGDVPRQRAANGSGRGRPANDDKTKLARKILADLLVTEGQYGHAPPDMLAAPEHRWRTEFFSRACVDDDKPNTKRVSFLRTAERLLNAEVIAINNGWVWLTHPEVE